MIDGPGSEIRVLCVDDDPDFADVTAQMLELRNDRFETVAVDSASAGLDALAEETYHCVVSDYDMPEMDGLAFLSAVRERFPDLPFVLFTGKGSEEIASEAIRAGVSDYIQKGAGRERFDLLAQRVENAADRARERTQRRIAERRYKQLFEQSVVGIGMSQNGVFQAANGRLADLFGYARSELVGLVVREVIAPEDRDVVERALRRREGGEVDSLHYVVTAIRADGERMEVEVHGGRITYDGEPAVLGIVVPVADRSYVDSPSGADRITAPDREQATREVQSADDSADSTEGDTPQEDRSPAVDGTPRESAATDDELTGATDSLDGSLSPERDIGEQSEFDRRFDDRDEPVRGVASLEEACRLARTAVDPDGETTLTVTDDATYDVEQSVLTEEVRSLLAAGLGEEPTGGQVTVTPTEVGFRVQIESPTVETRFDDDLVDGLGSRPPPITDVAKRRYWAVYTTSVGERAVEYEIEGPSRLGTAGDE
ncbi:MAG: response regulator [Halobaculum sp.]